MQTFMDPFYIDSSHVRLALYDGRVHMEYSVPQEITKEEIKDDLHQRSYPVSRVW